MSKSHHIVRTDIIRANAVMLAGAIPLEPLHECIIRPYEEDKTAEQRGWYHVLCGLFGDEVGLTLGEIKEITKAKLAGWKTISYGGIDLVVADMRSEKLSKKKYSQLIEVVYMLAADAGITLPPPRFNGAENR